LSPLIADAVDPIRGFTTLATIVADATAGLIITHSGSTMPLCGLPTHPTLTTGSALLTEVTAGRTCRTDHVVFLVRDDRGGAAPGYHRVTTLTCPSHIPDQVATIVLLSPPGDLRRLTDQELTILGMLIHDWDPGRVAAELRLSRHDVAAAMRGICAKFDALDSGAAVVRAAGQGLYLPPALSNPGASGIPGNR
jgi:DNA-binding CsgD family transcriptional regulator